jgi:peptide/nickel transport system permease protein
MLRHALRRLLWTLPTLIGVSILTFWFLSYVPDPTDDPAALATLGAEGLARERRARFLDLPRFVNFTPLDARARSLAAAQAIADDTPEAADAARELVRIGGAALPHVLPLLDALPPDRRPRVALALAPIARRMELGGLAEASSEAGAVAFWSRFWDDRGLEFRDATVRSAVRRLARYGTASRAADLRELDTFALDQVLEALEMPRDQAGIGEARALVDIAASMTGRDDRIGPEDDLRAASACVDRWQDYWMVYRSDFVVFTGASRVAAVVLETRYGKWALGAVTHRFGHDASGALVLDELLFRAKRTLLLVFGAIALAYAAAIPLGSLSAAYRGGRLDLAVASAVLALYAVPTAVWAVLAAGQKGEGPAHASLLAPTVLLALSLVAAPTRQQHAALASVLGRDFVRAALARGSSPARAALVHGLRNALLPVATLITLEAPIALGGAFVLERVFGLHGLGEATIQAVQARDTSWLMAISIFAAALASLLVLASDLACVVIDPRLAPILLARKGRT